MNMKCNCGVEPIFIVVKVMKRKIEKARKCYEKTEEKRNTLAQVNIGLLLIGRDDELKDAEKKQIIKSAEKGNTESIDELGCKYQ